MKIAVLSDIHLGYAFGTERGEDPFDALEEAVEKITDSDMILIVGDMFDTKIPGPEILTRAMQLLLKPLLKPSDAELIEGVGKDTEDLLPLASLGIPIVAIHGTHERRVKGLINPIESLERAGFLIHLHCNGVVFQKGDEKVCVQGMSGVPDQYADSVMKKWNPQPVEGTFNIIMLHQSIAQFIYAKHLMDINSIPKGFDLYISGHIHESKQTKYADAPFLIPGSFIPTQLTKESVQSRGFWIIDTENIPPKFEFIELENQRKVYHRTFRTDMNKDMIIEELKILTETPYKKKPIIRINFTGKENMPDHFIDDLKSMFGKSAILSFKTDIEEEMPVAKSMEEQKMSVQELGRKVLMSNLREFKLDEKIFECVFELLLDKKDDEAINLLNQDIESKL